MRATNATNATRQAAPRQLAKPQIIQSYKVRKKLRRKYVGSESRWVSLHLEVTQHHSNIRFRQYVYNKLSLLAPLVLLANLLFLLGSEVVLDVEGLANLLRGLALDHVGNSLAGDVKEGLDVEVVGSKNELEESGLVDLDELLIPGDDIVSALLVFLVVRGRSRLK